jgi:4-hydroxy-2-oxoheptanedioate aldolase
MAEIIASQWFDFVGVDVQHGLYGYESLVSAIGAVNTTPAATIVRVPSEDPAFAGQGPRGRCARHHLPHDRDGR